MLFAPMLFAVWLGDLPAVPVTAGGPASSQHCNSCGSGGHAWSGDRPVRLPWQQGLDDPQGGCLTFLQMHVLLHSLMSYTTHDMHASLGKV